jgi:glycine/D-amino acid oxidase-like deaminating enzyme
VKEYSYWLDTLPHDQGAAKNPSDSPSAKASSSATTADVAIVGAGYTGLAAARHLARVGASVVVLDRERVGFGASSRNGGQVLTGLKIDPETLIKRYGHSKARDLFAIAMDSITAVERLVSEEAIDCDYERSGHLQAAWKPAHFDAFRREQDLLGRVFGHDVQLVARTDQRTELGSDRYFGLLVDNRSAGINPARYVSGLAAAVIRAGARVQEGCAVQRIVRSGSRWKVVTDLGDLDAGDVLMATNGYTDGAAPFLQRRFVPIGSYIVATEPLSPPVARSLIPRRRMVFDSKHFLYYFRLSADNRLLFGGRAEFSKPDSRSTARAAAILRAALAVVFPDLRQAGIEYAWSGNVAFTRDQMPRAGRIDGLYYAGGYCGHGVAMATYLGTTIARRMAGEPIDHPLFDDRFAPIPLYNGAPWFLPLAGAYYRIRDILE